jgi:histone deacetylase 8
VYHSRDYLDLVLDAETSSNDSDGLSAKAMTTFGLEDVSLIVEGGIYSGIDATYVQDCPPFKGLPEYVQLVAGASLAAAGVLRHDKADVAICWDGGRSLLLLITIQDRQQ